MSRAITLVESSQPEHRAQARALLAGARRHPTEPAVRVGISGLPGVGKSTFIETLGAAADRGGPPRRRARGRPQQPAHRRLGARRQDPDADARRSTSAYIRASPSAGTLGGVARATSQAMLVLEAAAYDVVLVETVGVGQSETTVAGMVDTFLFLTLARTGDQLQGIKRGILELADVIAVNKADGDRRTEAQVAARELSRRAAPGARPRGRAGGRHLLGPVRRRASTTSGRRCSPTATASATDGLADKRAHQQLEFAWALVRDELEQRLRRSEPVRRVRAQVREQVLGGELPAVAAADRIARGVRRRGGCGTPANR